MNIKSHIINGLNSDRTRLNLSCNLKDFPEEIFEFSDTLEILDLSGNQLKYLPDSLPKLKKLKILFCSNNQFTELPAVLGDCPNLRMIGFKSNFINSVPPSSLGSKLRWLILTDNQISELPEAIGNCQDLEKLMLSGNQLEQLPATLSKCKNLKLIRIAANQLKTLPDSLFELPKLSWLALAGNPCNETCENSALLNNPIKNIPWHELTLHQKLGEGASGFIHQANWHPENHAPQDVAVKIFKGAMTSDGLPHSEKTACISAGAHPNLIPVIGKISQHPENATGLVMSLIDPDYHNLAGPPSLESCTRDVYSNDLSFTLESALSMAHDIADTAQHLHSKGIMHGDLYAHNILHNHNGTCLLGDFGAASFYSFQDQRIAEKLQQIEVRAYGYLLEEILSRCEMTNEKMVQLDSLRESCLQEEIDKRPLFKDIVTYLKTMT